MKTKLAVFGGATLGALVLVVALVAGSSAGTSSFGFFVLGPTAVTTGQPSIVFAKLTTGKNSGAATHTVITFTFPAGSTTGTPTADPNSPDCGAAVLVSGTATITCTIGVVQGGMTVKRFVNYTAGSDPGDSGITANYSFDQGTGGKGGGGGTVNGNSTPAPTTFVNGTSTDGRCVPGGSNSSAAGVFGSDTQQTQLTFGDPAANLGLPCSWGSVGVQSGKRGPDGAPAISTVEGPTYGGPATLTLTFSSLPVPLNKYVLMEFDPNNPNAGWSKVPLCPTPTTLPGNADACLIGYDKGKPIVAHLLYRGTGGDPWFN
jgi:hypothetical protein